MTDTKARELPKGARACEDPDAIADEWARLAATEDDPDCHLHPV